MELFNYFSSFVPQYVPIIYRRDWGNTLPIHAKFGNDWNKSLKKFVKKWNSYNNREEVVLNIIECGTNCSRMIQVQGEDTIFVASHYDTDIDLQFDPDFDFVEIVDGDTILATRDWPRRHKKDPDGLLRRGLCVCCPVSRIFRYYSHSIVAGGFELMS